MKKAKAGLLVVQKYALAVAVPGNLVPDDGELRKSVPGAAALRTYVAVAAAKAVAHSVAVAMAFRDVVCVPVAEQACTFRLFFRSAAAPLADLLPGDHQH